MYNMHKKCIVEDTAVTLYEIDTSKMYNMHKKCFNNRGYTTVKYIHLRCIICIRSV